MLLASACRTSPELAAPAGPQRPSVSSDTGTTAEGTLELELGLALDPDDALSTPVGIKYGSGPRTEVFLGLSPFNRLELAAGDEEGFGDLVVGTRHRMAEGEGGRPSFAVQAAVKLPTADDEDGLGSGELDASFALIATRAFGAGSGTAYYSFDVLGDPAGGTDAAHVLALAGGRSIGGSWGAALELAGLFAPEDDDSVYLVTANLTRALHPWLVFDVGVSAGLESDDPDPALLVGLTRNLGPLSGR